MFRKKPNENEAEAADREATEKQFADKLYQPEDVFAAIKKESKKRKFGESIDLCVKLNVDPTRGD